MPDAFGNPNVAELLAAGAANSVLWLEDFGRSRAEIYAHIRRTFGNATDRTLDALVNRSHRAQQAGARFWTIDSDRVIPLSQMPLSPNLQSRIPGNPQPRVVWNVVLQYRDGITNQIYYTTAEIESQSNLSRIQVEFRVGELWAQIKAGQRGSPGPRQMGDSFMSGFDVTQIWRTS